MTNSTTKTINVTVKDENKGDMLMVSTKSTKIEKFQMIRDIVADNEILAEFIDNEIALLTKKADYKKSHKTKKQTENAALGEKLLNVIPQDRFISIEEIKQIDEFGDLSTPKISALIRPLRENGLVVRDFDKKHAVYKRV